ncbi:hypothetical protein [Actinomadura monticuli]|uniref:Uncharacterized protein n=1 Tax=Actinomadura monticuli TaxID=3097367 RepID=A0ABV4Q786_9ACTN
MERAASSPRIIAASVLLSVSLVSAIAAITKGGSGDPERVAPEVTKSSKTDEPGKRPGPAAEPASVVWSTVAPPAGEQPSEWHAALNSHDCDSIGRLGAKRVQFVYQGLGAACAALADKGGTAWGPAALSLADVRQAPVSCMDAFAYRLLRDLVIAHLRQPGLPPKVTRSEKSIIC